MDRGAWQATVHGVIKESDTTEETEHPRLHDHLDIHYIFQPPCCHLWISDFLLTRNSLSRSSRSNSTGVCFSLSPPAAGLESQEAALWPGGMSSQDAQPSCGPRWPTQDSSVERNFHLFHSGSVCHRGSHGIVDRMYPSRLDLYKGGWEDFSFS